MRFNAYSMSKAVDVSNVPRGAASLTTQQIITCATYFIFYALLARVLTTLEVTHTGVLLATQAAFVALTQLGLPSSATRYISSNIARNDPETAGAVPRTLLKLFAMTVGAGFVIAAIVSPIIGPSFLGRPDGGSLLLITFASGLMLHFV